MEDRQSLLMSRIETAMVSLLRQMSEYENTRSKTIRIQTCNDESQKILFYRPSSVTKLSHDLCALSQVYKLLKNGQRSTKRDLYYDCKALYGNQQKLDRSLTAICELLNCTRVEINVLSCSKGLIRGALAFLPTDGSIIDCHAQNVLISESLMSTRPVNGASFIIVVEKDATFQKLIDDGVFDYFRDSILVTGKGYPDICTRRVLRWLVESLSIPIYGLFDADPHGIEILLTYKYGASKENHESRGSFVRDMLWLGLKPSHIASLPIAQDQCLPMKNSDFMKIARVRRRAVALNEHEIVAELDRLREMRCKFELEAVSSISAKYLPRDYLLTQLSSFLPQATE